MKTYGWAASFDRIEVIEGVKIRRTTAVMYGRPLIHANSEDQAWDRAEEVIEEKYGAVSNLKLRVHEVED